MTSLQIMPPQEPSIFIANFELILLITVLAFISFRVFDKIKKKSTNR